MTLTEALQFLGLAELSSAEDITKAWRKLCMIHHPDRGGNQHDFLQAKQAYKIAIDAAAAQKCRTCQGTGKIFASIGLSKLALRCPACKSTRRKT